MNGDFSRLTFDRRKRYSSVRMQQGRVQLDADWNEQADILQHLSRSHLVDLIGSHGTTDRGGGFRIISDPTPTRHVTPLPGGSDGGLAITAGHYYVDGMLCENESTVRLDQQPDLPALTLHDESANEGTYLVYLDVFQRHITAAEDPSIRETALGDADTTTRTKTVWQARLLPLDHGHDPLATHPGDRDANHNHTDLSGWSKFLDRQNDRTTLTVRYHPHHPPGTLGDETRDTEKGTPSPRVMESLENRLYRIEVHGQATTTSDDSSQNGPIACKWSRENGAISLPVVEFQKFDRSSHTKGRILLTLRIQGLSRLTHQIRQGDWVELVDRDSSLIGQTRPLWQVARTPDLHGGKIEVTCPECTPDLETLQSLKCPLIRKWDQTSNGKQSLRNGTLLVERETWFHLESGIWAQFHLGGSPRPGDHWQIPTRTHAPPRDWPTADPPHGPSHHYAPLAIVSRSAGVWRVERDCRQTFDSLTEIASLQDHDTSHLKGLLGDRIQEIRNELSRAESALTGQIDQRHEETRATQKSLADELSLLKSSLQGCRDGVEQTEILLKELQTAQQQSHQRLQTIEAAPADPWSEPLARLDHRITDLDSRLTVRSEPSVPATTDTGPLNEILAKANALSDAMREPLGNLEEICERLDHRISAVEKRPEPSFASDFARIRERIDHAETQLGDFARENPPGRTAKTKAQLKALQKHHTTSLENVKLAIKQLQDAFIVLKGRVDGFESAVDPSPQTPSPQVISDAKPADDPSEASSQPLHEPVPFPRNVDHRIVTEVSSAQPLEMGDVVSMAATPTGHVVRTNRFNGKMVMGVVEGEVPGESPDQKRYRIVLMGVTDCKVVGSVKPGHLLVPSWRRGKARRAGWFIKPGTLIGKALTRPTSGMIKVIVTLG